MSRPNVPFPTPVPGPSSQSTHSSRPSLGLDPSPISRDTGSPAVIPPRRQTSSSTRSAGQYTSALDSSITRLLVTTKQLLQGLEQWSQRIISESDVSDIYVRLGNGFEVCTQSFQRAGLSTSDLDAIPQDLRACLEQCLSYEQSHETLEVYLPEIRQIIYNLLHGLKQKQAAYKRLLQDRQREAPPPNSTAPMPTNAYAHAPPPAPASGPSHASSSRPHPFAQAPDSTSASESSRHQQRKPSRSESNPLTEAENRLSGRSGGSTHSASPASVNAQLPAVKVPSSSALAERGARTGLPSRPAPPDAFRPPRMRAPEHSQPRRSASPSPVPAPEPVRHQLVDKPVPSPPPQITVHALPQSKPPRPDRFSRDSYGSQRPVSRFSADSDITNGSPIRSPPNHSPRKEPSEQLPETPTEADSKPFLPPSLPVLNLPTILGSPDDDVSPQTPAAAPEARGAPSQPVEALPDVPPETRATLAALQRSDALERRASKRFSSYTFNKMLPGSPGKKSGIGSPQRPTRRAERAPPMPALPESLLTTAARAGSMSDESGQIPRPNAATLLQANGDIPATGDRSPSPTVDVTSDDASDRSVRVVKTPDPEDIALNATPRPRMSLSSPTSLGLFLQIGRQVKKANVDLPASLSNVRLLFMERFEYDPGMEDFPDVYIRDNRTGVQFELEDMEDLREGCVLSLNIEPLDQVKQHFDTTFASLMQEIKEMKKTMEVSRRMSTSPSHSLLTVSPSVQMSRPGTMVRQASTDTLQPSSSNAIVPPVPRPGSPSPRADAAVTLGPEKEKELKAQYEELQSLRRDLAIMRQLHVDFLSETKESFGKLRDQNSAMREVVKTKMGGSRAILDNSKAKLESKCQDTIQAVEEISDTVDAAREDAYKRFVTPSKGQMATIRSDLDKARKLVDQFASDVQLADPTWRATWQTELHRVMEEQKLLSYQLKLCSDLKNDIRDATEMFGNVQTFVNQRAAGVGAGGPGAGSRVGSKSFNRSPTAEEEGEGGIGNLLMEIRTKETDPNSRLRAIEAQQRAREKEKASQVDEFEQELKVGGKKLKKTGGTEEAERVRQRRQEVALRKMMNGEGPNTSGILSPQNTGTSMGGVRAISPQFTGPRAMSPQFTGSGSASASASASSQGTRAMTPQYTGNANANGTSTSNGNGGTANLLSPQMTGGSITAVLSPNLTGGTMRSVNANVSDRRRSAGGSVNDKRGSAAGSGAGAAAGWEGEPDIKEELE